jgi:transposase
VVSRSKSEAQAVLGEKFNGIGVIDDYAVYKSLFTQHQCCWAHLLRKAIKLMLQNPTESVYREFLDDLYGIYQRSVRWQQDQRLSVGRPQKVEELKGLILDLCTRSGEALDAEMPGPEQTFIRLQNELVKGIDVLFVFVAHLRSRRRITEVNGMCDERRRFAKAGEPVRVLLVPSVGALL